MIFLKLGIKFNIFSQISTGTRYENLSEFLKPKLIHKQKIENYYGKSFLYFLLYEMPQGTFHSPIDETEIKDYKHLKIGIYNILLHIHICTKYQFLI